MNIYPIERQTGLVKRQRVAAYCRVSTQMESQKSSIAAQREHYEDYIKTNPNWDLAGIYLEEGISGTKAESRPELRRMFDDCRAGLIDLVLTKSISRFSRNTSDCIRLVREFTGLGVVIRFEKEQIDTAEMGTEFLLTLLACFAEEESHSISGNIKWSIQKRFASGEYLPTKAPYGYQQEKYRLIPDPVQARVVRQIYDLLLSGYGAAIIADRLNREHIPGPTGREWNPQTIRKMVNNPVYAGDMLYQKTYTDEKFRVVKNGGAVTQYYIREHHVPLISRETFDTAGTILARRRDRFGDGEKKKRKSGLTGKLVCGFCGSPMYRQKSGNYPTFRCDGRTRHATDCRMKNEMEDSIKNAFITCFNKLSYSQSLPAEKRIIDVYIEGLRKDMTAENSRTVREHTCLAEELKRFLARWKTTDRTEDFPDKAFACLITQAMVLTGEKVEFHFACGLQFTESLRRPE